ncbi:MAG TPA: hypothetical protein VK689_22180 [Armatimonadota bacterium]|nr:hypothetical protein [Armatimonadota bacterium]
MDRWRELRDAKHWKVTSETERLLKHWRAYSLSGIRPFFCQVEAVEAAIWQIEAAPGSPPGAGAIHVCSNRW